MSEDAGDASGGVAAGALGAGVVVGIAVLAYWLVARSRRSAGTATSPRQAAAGDAKKNAANATKASGPPLTIYYASQSGTAESFAFEMEKEAKTQGFSPKVVDIEEYDEDTFCSEKFVVMLFATFGEGEPTDSAVQFMEWLMSEDRDPDALAGVDCAVFGLGNRQYEHFCAMGRKVSKRMKELGATEIVEHGEGDDDGSLEDDFAQWRENFWPVACERFHLAGSTQARQDKKFEPSYELTWTEEKKEHASTASGMPAVVMDPKHNGAYAMCVVNEELRQDAADGGSTRHIELDISNLPLRYQTADNLGVCPRNNQKLVMMMARRLGVDTRDVFLFKPKDSRARKTPIPSPCTVGDALSWYCDITSIPKGSLLEALAQYATDPVDKEKLLHYRHERKAEFLEDQKSLLELLEEVPSIKPPFGHFLELCPHLQPRFYTISSSSKRTPGHIHITVSVTMQQKPRARMHEGVCSTYLKLLKPHRDHVAVFVRPSSFRPPWEKKHSDADAALWGGSHPPLIMVGPGTGVAPFRAFIQEAEHLLEEGVKLGKLVLYFGCRRSSQDFIYREELTRAQQNILHKLHVAFSREPGQSRKVYVQQLMAEHIDDVWQLIHIEKGYFYVCGGTSMGRDVRNCLMEMAKAKHGCSEEAAQQYVKNLQDSGRYIQELWS